MKTSGRLALVAAVMIATVMSLESQRIDPVPEGAFAVAQKYCINGRC
jgi:hypothetical protein